MAGFFAFSTLPLAQVYAILFTTPLAGLFIGTAGGADQPAGKVRRFEEGEAASLMRRDLLDRGEVRRCDSLPQYTRPSIFQRQSGSQSYVKTKAMSGDDRPPKSRTVA